MVSLPAFYFRNFPENKLLIARGLSTIHLTNLKCFQSVSLNLEEPIIVLPSLFQMMGHFQKKKKQKKKLLCRKQLRFRSSVGTRTTLSSVLIHESKRMYVQHETGNTVFFDSQSDSWRPKIHRENNSDGERRRQQSTFTNSCRIFINPQPSHEATATPKSRGLGPKK